MKVIIVDDEPKAIKLVTSYLKHFSSFELVGTFRNGLKALEFLNSNLVDVIFLDINMPHLSGLSLSKMLPKETAIVFTTAYSEHAVDSYNVNTIDYLLKPISLERFTKAIHKLIIKKEVTHQIQTNNDILFVKSGLETHQIQIHNILYLQKDGNYMNYHFPNKKIMARENITHALDKLPDNFIQIHKSYIVNTRAIESFSSDTIIINQIKIPIGNQYKDQLTNFLK